MNTGGADRAMVVLLHGLAAGGWQLRCLARRVAAAGHVVHVLDYPTRTRALSDLGDRWLPAQLEALEAADAPRLHLVGHSMGGLVLRRFLAGHRPANLGRVVQLAPPNHGSALADRLGRVALLRWLLGRNLTALGTGPGSFWRTLPEPAGFPIGVIAGDRAVNPFGHLWLTGPHDGTVAVESTRLEGMADAVQLPFSHTGMLFRRETAEQVLAFLRDGKFRR